MNTTLLTHRFTLRSLMQRRLTAIIIATVSVLMIGLASMNVSANDLAVCSTDSIKVDMTNRGTLAVYGSADEGPAGALFVAEIPLSSIRNITEAERASGETISITSYDSTIIPGWHVDIYWKNEYYGVHLTDHDSEFVDDTGAACAL